MAIWQGTNTFTSNSKYNFSDLNRENTNIQYLSDSLAAIGYNINQSMKVSYLRTDMPKVSDINATKQAILNLIQSFYAVSAPVITVNPARLQPIDYTIINAIEQNTQALYDMFNKLSGYLKYCGQFGGGFYCGQDNTYL